MKEQNEAPLSYLYSPPTYITPLNSQEDEKRSDGFLKDAIVSRERLIVWQNNIYTELKHPCTIVEFKPVYREQNDVKQLEMVKNCRLDAPLSHNRVCRNIRKIFGSKQCYLCDDLLVRLFANADVENLEASFNKNKKAFLETEIADKYYKHAHLIPKFERDSLRGHIRVVCPMSGYVELIFPIVVEGTILGVLFVGQLSLKSRQTGEHCEVNVRRAFLHSDDIYLKAADGGPSKLQQYIFEVKRRGKEYYLREDCNDVDGIVKYLLSPVKPSQKYLPIFIDSDDELYEAGINEDKLLDDNKSGKNEYSLFIENAVKYVKFLEAQLIQELIDVRGKYILSRVETARKEFFNEWNQRREEFSDALSAEPLRSFWDMPKKVLDKLLIEFDIPYTTILGTSEIHPLDPIDDMISATRLKEAMLKPLMLSRRLNSTLSAKKKDIYFDMQKIDVNALPNMPKICYEDDPLFEGMVYNEHKFSSNDTSHLIYFPTIGKQRLPLLTLVVYPKASELDTAKMVTGNLQNLLTSIFYVYSSLVGYIAENRAENTMILYRHEAAQIAAGIKNINNLYLNANGIHHDHYKRSKKKQQDVHDDIARFTLLLSSMSERIRIIQGRHEVNESSFEAIRVIKEVLNNWTSAYSPEKDALYLEFDVPKSRENDNYRPIIATDRVLLNQIVFNIFGNAIKYAFKGTTIYLDYSRYFEYGLEKMIIIKNYGIGIHLKGKEKSRLFELYYREPHAMDYSDDSCGIGLYVAKKAVDYLGGNINYFVEKVSNFVVPYLKPFLEMVKRGIIKRNEISPIDGLSVADYEKEVQKELETLQREGIFAKVVSGKDIMTEAIEGIEMYPVTSEEIKACILARKPTYEVRFEVSLYAKSS